MKKFKSFKRPDAMTPIDSGNVAAAAYTPEGVVWVMFRNGREYIYENVPEAYFDAMMAADRPGKFFHHNIRTAFPYREVP